ncbi:MAG TPA: ribosome silencing factor [Acidiferrobacteraceae bacterium]|nr:ribosome silencing factor [Acidiferrobacteraceae bacterium]HEX20051.1 ribosome silencing factor [Acidiferrobacteraceae bacterium]
MKSEEMKDAVIGALEDSKARNIRVLDVRDITDITDYLIIASGTSNRHVASSAEKVLRRMQELGIKPLGKEGLDGSEWALLDFGDLVVHIMLPKTREFYALEKLWGGSNFVQSIES